MICYLFSDVLFTYEVIYSPWALLRLWKQFNVIVKEPFQCLNPVLWVFGYWGKRSHFSGRVKLKGFTLSCVLEANCQIACPINNKQHKTLSLVKLKCPNLCVLLVLADALKNANYPKHAHSCLEGNLCTERRNLFSQRHAPGKLQQVFNSGLFKTPACFNHHVMRCIGNRSPHVAHSKPN